MRDIAVWAWGVASATTFFMWLLFPGLDPKVGSGSALLVVTVVVWAATGAGFLKKFIDHWEC